MEKGKERIFRGKGFTLYHQNFPKKQLRLHHHNESHLIIPLQGSVELEVEGLKHHFGPGRMIYIGSKVPHSFSGVGEMGERLVLEFDQRLVKGPKQRSVAVVPTHPLVKDLCLSIFPYAGEKFESSMIGLLLEVLASTVSKQEASGSSLFATHQRILQSTHPQLRKLVSLMEERLDTELAELAREIGASARTMSRLVQNEVGLTPKELYTFFRVQKACELIFDGQLNLTGIAYECGYSSLSQFILNFKKWTGQTPSDFRSSQ